VKGKARSVEGRLTVGVWLAYFWCRAGGSVDQSQALTHVESMTAVNYLRAVIC